MNNECALSNVTNNVMFFVNIIWTGADLANDTYLQLSINLTEKSQLLEITKIIINGSSIKSIYCGYEILTIVHHQY